MVAEVNEEDVKRLFEALVSCFRQRHRLWLFGCGGSASNASHIASEFVSHWTGIKLPALALTTDPAVITAIANDYGFEEVFSRQVEAVCQRGDIVIGLSTSGVAPSVEKGLVKAESMGIVTSAWTGSKGLKFARLSEFPIVVNKEWVGTIQERHLELGHLLSDMVCKHFFDRVHA
jgi:D-sedoheptulose 7-phosphate isomerase